MRSKWLRGVLALPLMWVCGVAAWPQEPVAAPAPSAGQVSPETPAPAKETPEAPPAQSVPLPSVLQRGANEPVTLMQMIYWGGVILGRPWRWDSWP